MNYDPEALMMAARFAYGPKYETPKVCSPTDSADIFAHFIQTGENHEEIIRELEQFRTFYPYLITTNPQSPFSMDAVGMYLGISNFKLQIPNGDVFLKLIDFMVGRGILREFAGDLQKKAFKDSKIKFMPHHAWGVLWGQFISDQIIPENMAAISHCLPRYAVVDSLDKTEIRIKTFALTLQDKKIEVLDSQEILQFKQELVKGLSLFPGQKILIHRGFVVATLDETQLKIAKANIRLVVGEFNRVIYQKNDNNSP